MSIVYSNHIVICKECGAVVWWDRMQLHADFHDSTVEHVFRYDGHAVSDGGEDRP